MYKKIVLFLFHFQFSACQNLLGNGYDGKYIIDTSKCQIPDLDPFSDDVKPLYYHKNYPNCSDKPLLTEVITQKNVAILRIKDDIEQFYGNEVKCCYSTIVRFVNDIDEADNNLRYSRCRYFDDEALIKSDTFVVRCKNEQNVSVYENVYSPYLINEKIRKKLNMHSIGKRKPSVLFVVLDSVSRLNLIRTMPKTRKFLFTNNFIELRGYNKIDDNTYPNFMAFMTGLTLSSLSERNCSGNHNYELDYCDMIWYKFRKEGYITAYGEDNGRLGTFNFMKKGFVNRPTDYYFRPYVLATERLNVTVIDYNPFCVGPESSGERQLDLAKNFAVTFKNKPYFGIFWMNTFSHDSLNGPTGFDDKLGAFFGDLRLNGILDDSIVIFLADHGQRMDWPIRLTYQGWLEERLPMNLISIPKWFQQQYEQEYESLIENSKKLTSTFDLYNTLEHILELSNPQYKRKESSDCRTCSSLFKRIPNDRSCSEAGIPLQWCSCFGYFNPIEKDHKVVINFFTYLISRVDALSTEYSCLPTYELDFKILELKYSEHFSEHNHLFLRFSVSSFNNAEYVTMVKVDKYAKHFSFISPLRTFYDLVPRDSCFQLFVEESSKISK